MRILRKRRPSASIVIASLALLVALSGTSIASVANVPLLSVGTPQIKPNAVTAPKVKNRSLLAVDFKLGQLPRGPRGVQGPAGPSGPAGPAGAAAPGYVAQVSSQSSGSAVTTTSTSYVDLAGSTESIVVPAGETARIYAVFSAESVCSGGGLNRLCGARIVVDGNELNPAVGNDFAFDSNDDGDEGTSSWESHAIARSSETLAAGNHQIKVQIRTSNAATTLRVDDWSLVIFRTKVS